jgi:hypothetical protein
LYYYTYRILIKEGCASFVTSNTSNKKDSSKALPVVVAVAMHAASSSGKARSVNSGKARSVK